MTNLVNPGKPNNLSPKDAWPSTFNSNDSGEASKLVEIEPAKPSRFAQQLANDMQSEKAPNRSGPSASPTNTPKKYDRVSQKNDDGQFIGRHEKFAGLENQAAPKEFLRASPKDRPTQAADGKRDLELQTRVLEDRNPSPTAKKSSKSNPGSPVPTNSLSNSNEDQAFDSNLSDLDPKPSDKSSPQSGLMKKDTDQSLGDSAPKQTSDWGQRLKNALASMGGMGSFLQQNPALALLSGHLEAIEPAQIPVIISASPLIQQLLAAPQSLDVLQSPISMNQGLQVLGLNQTSINPEQAGPTTNLQELLKTLGFDESRICKEGDLLRDNLSLGDIGPYMKRAEILRAELGLLPMAVQTKSPLLSSRRPS
ncbi:MAG: hypothetical protein NTX25_15310 [Proteobacteria bacterium]|nr:hypothetical protein [Pseudomonadota bacterium]